MVRHEWIRISQNTHLCKLLCGTNSFGLGATWCKVLLYEIYCISDSSVPCLSKVQGRESWNTLLENSDNTPRWTMLHQRAYSCPIANTPVVPRETRGYPVLPRGTGGGGSNGGYLLQSSCFIIIVFLFLITAHSMSAEMNRLAVGRLARAQQA